MSSTKRGLFEPAPDFNEALAALSNPELLSTLDLTLLELEKRLLHYPRVGDPEVLEMAKVRGKVCMHGGFRSLGQKISATRLRSAVLRFAVYPHPSPSSRL